jgi:hypothetical protein
MKPTPPRLLAPCELAALWSCSTKQILTLCREGKLPHIRLNDRVIRISEVDAGVFYLSRRNSPQLDTTSD